MIIFYAIKKLLGSRGLNDNKWKWMMTCFAIRNLLYLKL